MLNQPKGILFLEIVSSTGYLGADIHKVILRFRESIKAIESTHFQAQFSGDGSIVVFPSPAHSYQSLKALLKAWMTVKEGLQSPLNPGIRLVLHAGSRESVFSESGALYGDAISFVARLMHTAPADSLVVSKEAFEDLVNMILSDGIAAEKCEFVVQRGTSIEAYLIRISSFLRPDQYLIRLHPPIDLVFFLASHPESMYKIPPRKFEEVVAELLAGFGYSVELTKQTRDRGIDIIALRRDFPLGFEERYLVQCKRNAPRNKVGLSVVHQILGVGAEEPNTGLIIATTSTFTKPAHDLAKKESVRWRLHLKDYEEIQRWLLAYSRKT